MATVDHASYSNGRPYLGAQPSVFSRVTAPADYNMVTATGDFTDGDILRIFKLPVNVKIVDFKIICEDLDSGTDLEYVVRITDGTTTKNLISAGIAARAAGVHDLTAHGTTVVVDGTGAYGFVTDTNDYHLEIVWTDLGTNTAANLQFEVQYTNILEAGESN